MTTDVKDGTGRFPVPRERWILDQLPESLMGFFGFRGEELPDRFHETVDYTYSLQYPGDGGGSCKYPFLSHYLADDGIPTVFIIGDVIELDGDRFRVLDYTSQRSATCTDAGEPFSYLHWEVQVAPVSRSSCA